MTMSKYASKADYDAAQRERDQSPVDKPSDFVPWDLEAVKQEILDLFARYGSGNYMPTEEEKEIIDTGLDEILTMPPVTRSAGTRTTANPERRSSLELSEVKPDEHDEGRSGEVDREGGGSTTAARSDAVGAGRAECSPRPAGREADQEGVTQGAGADFAPAYPNLKAILDGRVSGHYTEWPMVRVELRRLLASFTQSASVSINPEVLAALRDYTQNDVDGVWCAVSRQALDEAIAVLDKLPKECATKSVPDRNAKP